MRLHSHLKDSCRLEDTMIVPDEDAGALVPVRLRAPTHDAERAIPLSTQHYDHEPAIVVQEDEAPIVDEAGVVWVLALIYLSPDEIRAELGTCIF